MDNYTLEVPYKEDETCPDCGREMDKGFQCSDCIKRYEQELYRDSMILNPYDEFFFDEPQTDPDEAFEISLAARNYLSDAKLSAIDTLIQEVRKGGKLNYIKFYEALEAWATCRSAQNKLLVSYIKNGY